MFNPSSEDVRNFFFEVYAKSSNKLPLSDMEKMAYSIILEHPEYNQILANKEKYLSYNWLPEHGQINPFLHMSMHLAIIEQLSINQPVGIKDLYQELCNKIQDEHKTHHELMDCIAEMIWIAQSNNMSPDVNVYFKCINKKLGKIE